MRPPSCRISKTFSDLLPGENGHKITEIDFTASKLSGLLGAALGTERTGGHRFVVLDMVELFASGKLCTKAEDVIDLPALTGPVCNKREASNKVYTSKLLRGFTCQWMGTDQAANSKRTTRSKLPDHDTSE
ncbi:hypothetical protein L917_20541 [Phytophthora nicotianae]|uniref:Uncharacterized protein n=3 Tax=Phytophthora nicotianae TaxID=4792 RepID=W2QRZ1_PHYN3|nr:hypothetical protein PPTG_21826 [Phytophthora nicotianae INRA-310]ETL78675.1 hypothetical protein L917_20541 [Phytophthora nicotianae]ETN15873.1 hypothetical protein PPTG_21826 [Phytophthora nicotianae INRA-310]ETO60367.1 hypothetical protein F444_21416 [Phytophthora nicotianae P1976]